jgi:hypothetical protein
MKPRHATNGAFAACAGTWAMSHAQRLWTRAAGAPVPHSAAGKHDARDWQEREEGQNANELAAQAVATRVTGRPLESKELRYAATAMHYAFGSAVGAVYGAVMGDRIERASRTSTALLSGAALGAALWVTADEIAMPLLGLSRPTTERGLERHLQSLTAHLVYGLVTAAVFSGMNRRARSVAPTASPLLEKARSPSWQIRL